MYTSDAVDDIVDTLHQHVTFLTSQPDSRLLAGLPAFIRFVEHEPLLSSVISELKRGADASVNELNSAARSVNKLLVPIWKRLRPLLALTRDKQLTEGTREFDDTENFGEFENDLVSADKEPANTFLHFGEPDYDSNAAFGRGSKMQEWTWSAMRSLGTADQTTRAELERIESDLGNIQQDAIYASRRFWIDSRTLSGYSYQRLEYAAQWVNPPPRTSSDDPWVHTGHVFLGREWVSAIYSFANESPEELQDRASTVRRDLEILRLELRSVVLLGRASMGLLRRFASRCERFDSHRMRRLAIKTPRQAESQLRVELARFMFDCGLNPLLDPSVSSLRPDLLDTQLGHSIYVEAKQYRGGGSKDQVIKGFRQVLDTRGRLRNAFTGLSDAFLAIFRLDGPRIELPEVVHVEGGRIFLILVDIGPTAASGSRQKRKPITLTVDDLLDGNRPHALRR